jgi:hypothetical protein
MDSEFEQRLRRQPMKKVPGEWRAEILAAASQVNRRQEGSVSREFTFAATGREWLANLLWPHPKAWAGLAAVWIFIFVLNFSMRDNAPALAVQASPPSPEAVAELRQQHQMLVELIGPAELQVADRAPALPLKPRSERAEALAA